MERLVDPLTTTDAKLWADEFMKVKARLGEQKFDHAMMLGWFANAIMQGYDEGRRRAKADAQATVDLAKAEGAAEVRKVIQQRLIDVRLARSVARLSFAQDEYDAQISALESILKQCEEPFSSNNENGLDLQATVEALQRERDEWRSNAVAQEARANDLERDCKDLLSDIDGERAKVGDLLKKIAYWEKRHSTYRELAEENMNLKSDELSALQGLVEALQRERDELREATKVICGHCCEPMAIPSKAILKAHLSKLQGLVRAYLIAKNEADATNEDQDCKLWREKYRAYDVALTALEATLPATPTERG